jgi:hypothetical protein
LGKCGEVLSVDVMKLILFSICEDEGLECAQTRQVNKAGSPTFVK